MSAPGIIAVIGGCFGDEGKGLAVDWLCAGAAHPLVIRHNGGAQAGHTVETEDGRRFVFHQLSAGSFCRADTLWANTFTPDLYKLSDELAAFQGAAGFQPRIFAEAGTQVVTVDDVLLNMALETARGANRHGSCGMGIWEAKLRADAGFGISLGAVQSDGAAALAAKLREIRREYLPGRLQAAGLTLAEAGEYGALLTNPAVPENAAQTMCRNAARVEIFPAARLHGGEWDRLVFEGGQGLLLDAENEFYAPHVTASRTGLTNPLSFCRRHGLTLDTAVYVIRSYVTRHGAGPLPFACPPGVLGRVEADRTNVENPWQGTLRYAAHPSPAALAGRFRSDLTQAEVCVRAALFVTHLNETDGLIRFRTGDCAPAALFQALQNTVSVIYGANGRTNALVRAVAGAAPKKNRI